MIQVKIKNTISNQYTHGSIFESRELANDWINSVSAKSPCPWGTRGSYEIEIEDLSLKIRQELVSKQAKAFLESTDYKILRHIRQKALGERLSLTEEQYLELERARSEAAASIVE